MTSWEVFLLNPTLHPIFISDSSYTRWAEEVSIQSTRFIHKDSTSRFKPIHSSRDAIQVNANPLRIFAISLSSPSPSPHSSIQTVSIIMSIAWFKVLHLVNPFNHSLIFDCLISFFSSNRDLPPQGGYAPIRYKRNLPSKGPGGLVVFGGIIAICSFGFWKVGQSNLEQRSVVAAAAVDQRDFPKFLSSPRVGKWL